jgi:hypothetical protein
MASIKRSGRFYLNLQSTDKEDASEGWMIVGDGHPAGTESATNKTSFELDVIAEKAELVRFRPFMPQLIRKNASDISGHVGLNLHIVAGSGPWEGGGDVFVTDAEFQYDGEQWRAKAMNVDLEKVGAGLLEQVIRKVDVQEWHYQAALRPFNLPVSTNGESSEKDAEGVKSEPWHIQELQMNNGLITVGHADSVWAQSVEIHVENLRPNIASPVEMKASMGDGSLTVYGDLLWNTAIPELHKAKILVRDVLPFFMNEWLTISDAPQMIRGRLYADVSVQQEDSGAYKGLGYLRLQHGILGPVESQNDLLLSRTGFNSYDVVAALQEDGRVRVRVPLQGEGPVGDLLGSSLLQALKRDVIEKGGATKSLNYVAGQLLSSVRLHEKGSLSHNERARLRKVIKHMRENPKKSIELKPKLGSASQDGKQIERTRYTQDLIEDFLVYRGVSRSRIFPVLPNEQHKNSGSTSGVEVVIIP